MAALNWNFHPTMDKVSQNVKAKWRSISCSMQPSQPNIKETHVSSHWASPNLAVKSFSQTKNKHKQKKLKHQHVRHIYFLPFFPFFLCRFSEWFSSLWHWRSTFKTTSLHVPQIVAESLWALVMWHCSPLKKSNFDSAHRKQVNGPLAILSFIVWNDPFPPISAK